MKMKKQKLETDNEKFSNSEILFEIFVILKIQATYNCYTVILFI